MAVSAREHYYNNVAPEEDSKNYQQVHQSYIYEDRQDPSSVRVYSHVPRYSNDLLIEQYVTELLELVAPPIAPRLRGVFVAKRLNFFANAGALHAKEKYEGDLIFFYVGLSDVLFQYAILYEEFQTLTRARTALGDDAADTKELFVELCRDIQKLSEAQIDWGINRNEIRFQDETVLVPAPKVEGRAATVATLMDKAVLRHEIAHHLLGHTSSGSDLSDQLRQPIEHFLKDAGHSSEHNRELEADLCGIYLPMSGQRHVEPDQLGFEVALGTLLAQTALAQLKASIHLSSVSHPSWKVRHQLSIRALREFYPLPGYEAALSGVSRFQALLYLVQQRGLGELTFGSYDLGAEDVA
ncbi:MAG: hypothetical protein HYX47_07885 [Burkholderiales bacterium]|nr:hypothetical protein [Burkholderiales bacterium]